MRRGKFLPSAGCEKKIEKGLEKISNRVYNITDKRW